MPPEAALWIASAQVSGGIYLSLVAKDYAPRVVPAIAGVLDDAARRGPAVS